MNEARLKPDGEETSWIYFPTARLNHAALSLKPEQFYLNFTSNLIINEKQLFLVCRKVNC